MGEEQPAAEAAVRIRTRDGRWLSGRLVEWLGNGQAEIDMGHSRARGELEEHYVRRTRREKEDQ